MVWKKKRKLKYKCRFCKKEILLAKEPDKETALLCKSHKKEFKQ